MKELELFTRNGKKVTMLHITLPNIALHFFCNKSSECSDGFVGNMTTTVSTEPMTKDTIKGKMCFNISLKDTTENGKKRWSYSG